MIKLPNYIYKQNTNYTSDIPIVNLKRSIVDTNLKLNIKSFLTIELSYLIDKMSNLEFNLNNNGFTEIIFKTYSNKEIKFILPINNIKKFFTSSTFNPNFYIAFQQEFPQKTTSSLFFGLKIDITNNLPFNTSSTLKLDELKMFRLFVCLFFGLYFNINLDCCACYPKNISELNAINSGIGLNCVYLECKNQLLQNPSLFDNLIHTDCPFLGVQAAFVSINAFSADNIKFENINIDQTMNCIANNTISTENLIKDTSLNMVSLFEISKENLKVLAVYKQENNVFNNLLKKNILQEIILNEKNKITQNFNNTDLVFKNILNKTGLFENKTKYTYKIEFNYDILFEKTQQINFINVQIKKNQKSTIYEDFIQTNIIENNRKIYFNQLLKPGETLEDVSLWIYLTNLDLKILKIDFSIYFY